ncbi:hypothetical protein [Synechococcus sp. PCC 7336]|uniref:hypothetical protein n=1 Tax=Synechococcus sp. PCC 7336 TaxID=195250 RepID=UPI000344E619|nr:hypothetical protein [Synechococcus sp. PCC 7336]
MQLNNPLNLEGSPQQDTAPPEQRRRPQVAGLQTEFEFELPKGYVDAEGTLHRQGVMRLARAMDEIVPLRDPRVKANPAYATVVILARVIVRLGALSEVSPAAIEDLFACDLNYLQKFYRQINELEED